MESIGDILVRTFKKIETDIENNNNPESVVIEKINEISEIDKELNKSDQILLEAIKSKKKVTERIFSYFGDLLKLYAEFKRVPRYYKTIDGKAQDYIFFETKEVEIKGLRIVEKNTRKNDMFISEELYILNNGSFYKFISEVKEVEGYKECFRDFKGKINDPSNEWDLLNTIDRIRDILQNSLDMRKKCINKEEELAEFLLWIENDLEAINSILNED